MSGETPAITGAERWGDLGASWRRGAHPQAQDLRCPPGGDGPPSLGVHGGEGAVGLAVWQPARGVDLQTKDAVYTLSAMTSGIRRNWIEALRKTVRPTSAPDVTKYVPSWSGTLREALPPASLSGVLAHARGPRGCASRASVSPINKMERGQ